jgi:hypothetical protein
MDERSVLLSKIQNLIRELDNVGRSLRAQNVDSEWLDLVRVKFDKFLGEKTEYLLNLRWKIESQTIDPNCWTDLYEASEECRLIFKERLAFIEGSMDRSAKVDGGLCKVADVLLYHLSHLTGNPWDRFTILAEGEFFAGISDIIRIRFPQEDIWSLPIAAHELGHFIGPKIELKACGRTYKPLEEIIEREKAEGIEGSFIKEYFADIFATYSMGPAYACACILSRFDPWVADMDIEGHPSCAKRAYLIMNALDRVSKTRDVWEDKPYGGISDSLKLIWQRCLDSCGKQKDLTEPIENKLDQLLNDLFRLADENPGIRYGKDCWKRAESQLVELRPGKTGDPILRKDATIPDILNAAWICRMQHWDKDLYTSTLINDRAYKLCTKLMK